MIDELSELPSGGRPGQTLLPNNSTWLVLLEFALHLKPDKPGIKVC